MATAKNTPTATNERFDSRARPQTPCPDVQPLPILVPKPMSSPETAIQSGAGTDHPAGGAASRAGCPPGPPTPSPGSERPEHQGHEEDEAPDLGPGGREQLAEQSRDAGDAAVAQPQQRRGKADEHATGKGGNGGERVHGEFLRKY